MKALARGFLAGFGFALGASVAGTLIGYTIGRIGEASVKRLLSSAPTSSPAPSSSPASSEPPDTKAVWNDGYEEGLAMGSGVDMRLRCQDCTFATLDQGLMISHVAGTTHRGDKPRTEHKSHYGATEHAPGSHFGGCPDRDWTGEPYLSCEAPHMPVLEPIGERCGARNGDLVCILSKGHTKPVDHWNGTFGFDAAPFHTCEIGVPDADHPLRTDSAHCGECAPQCDLFPGQTCTAVPQKCRTFCERR